MSFQTNTNSSTAPQPTPQTSINNPVVSDPDFSQTFVFLTNNLNRLEQKIDSLEAIQRPEKNFFKYSTLNSMFVFIVFLLLPFFQITITIIVLNNIFPHRKDLYDVLIYVLPLLGLATLIELVFVPIYLKNLLKKI